MKLGGWVMMLTTMVLFMTLVGVSTSFTIILNLLGVTQVEGASGVVLSGDVEGSSLWNNLFGVDGIIAGLGVGTAVAVGLFIATKEIGVLLIPFIVLVGQTYIGTFWATIMKVSAYGQWWMTSIVVLIFTSLAVGFIVALVDYFGGR